MDVVHLKNAVFKIFMKIPTLQMYKTFINDSNNLTNYFIIDNIDPKQSLTLANSIRRILLSENYGIGITKFKIEGIKNEYTNIPGIREDILDIILNLNQIVLKSNDTLHNKSFSVELTITHPGIITANSIKFGSNFKIVNPNQYIMTVTKPLDLTFEFLIEKNKLNDIEKSIENNWFPLNNKFNPILNVNFDIYHLKSSNIKTQDCIKFEITTNGSITPQNSLKNALIKFYKILNPLTLYKI